MEKQVEIITHGSMRYECENCGKVFFMYLECGVEPCRCEKMCNKFLKENKCEYSKGLMPSPFMITCACGGTAKHIDWHMDVNRPLPVFDHMSYFKLDREGLKNNDEMACGISVVKKNSRDLRITPRGVE
jgi:hypothetical protein